MSKMKLFSSLYMLLCPLNLVPSEKPSVQNARHYGIVPVFFRAKPFGLLVHLWALYSIAEALYCTPL